MAVFQYSDNLPVFTAAARKLIAGKSLLFLGHILVFENTFMKTWIWELYQKITWWWNRWQWLWTWNFEMEIDEKQSQTIGSSTACSSSYKTLESRMLLEMIWLICENWVLPIALTSNPGWLLWLCCGGLSENPAQHRLPHLEHWPTSWGRTDDCCTILKEVTEKLVGWFNLFARLLENMIIKQRGWPYTGNPDIAADKGWTRRGYL